MRERGQISTGLILTVSVLIAGFGAWFMIDLARATDERSQIQTAADAAALAGAQSAAKEAPGQIVSALRHGGSLGCGLGRDAAADFARRNAATLVRYCYYPISDRVEVEVRSDFVTASGEREESEAVARLGARLGPCVLPTPSPTPTPTPTPSFTPSPTSSSTPTPTPTVPDVDVVAHCGDIEVRVTFPGNGGDPIFHLDASDLADVFDPALTE